MENVLEIEHLSLSLPSKKGMIPILHDVNLEVGEGKIMGLVGESGSGKWGRGQKVGPIDRGVRRSIYVFA